MVVNVVCICSSGILLKQVQGRCSPHNAQENVCNVLDFRGWSDQRFALRELWALICDKT